MLVGALAGDQKPPRNQSNEEQEAATSKVRAWHVGYRPSHGFHCIQWLIFNFSPKKQKMAEDYHVAIISASSALLGSVIGGVISFLTTRDASAQQWRQSLVIREIERKEALYSEFIAECAKLLLSALDKKMSSGSAFSNLYTLLGKIRMMSSDEVRAAAEDLAQHATDAHRADYMKTETTGDNVFQSRNRFTEIARKELDEIKKRA